MATWIMKERKLLDILFMPCALFFLVFFFFIYSRTCLKQAAKGQGKIACLRQVLA